MSQLQTTPDLQTAPPDLMTQLVSLPHQVLIPRQPTDTTTIGQNGVYQKIDLFPCPEKGPLPPMRSETVLIIRAWGRHNEWVSFAAGAERSREFKLQEFAVSTHGSQSVCRQVFDAVQSLVGGVSKYDHDQVRSKLSQFIDRSDAKKCILVYTLSWAEWRGAKGLQFHRYTHHPLTKDNETAKRWAENVAVGVAAVGLYTGARVGSKYLTDWQDARARAAEEERLKGVQEKIKNELTPYLVQGKCNRRDLTAEEKQEVSKIFKSIAAEIKGTLENLAAKLRKAKDIPGLMAADLQGVAEFLDIYLVAEQMVPVHLDMMCALQTLDYQPVAALAATGPVMTKLLQRFEKYIDAAHTVLMKRVFDEAQAGTVDELLSQIEVEAKVKIEKKAFKAGSVNQVHKTTDGKHVIKFVKPSVVHNFKCEKALYAAHSKTKCSYLDELISNVNAEMALDVEYKNYNKAKPVYNEWKIPAMEYNENLQFLKMDLVDGETVKAIMATENQQRCKEIKKNLVKPIQNWFNVLFQRGFAHGDLHPGNILIDKENNPWMIDFGLCFQIRTVDDVIPLHDFEAREEAFKARGAAFGAIDKFANMVGLVLQTKVLVLQATVAAVGAGSVVGMATVASGAPVRALEKTLYGQIQEMYGILQDQFPEKFYGAMDTNAVTLTNRFFKLNTQALKGKPEVFSVTMQMLSAINAVHSVVKLYNVCAARTDSTNAEIDECLRLGVANISIGRGNLGL